ncbi:Ribosomal RNA small subunit methyltransferase I [Sporomusa paucivorans]|uniref:Ribosomal RNA small subunit methyltransferase I n=2 Tax=Sporomusaceae TaxID=1843490 RepID=A0ABP2C386_9FIRM|nr:MULTISPECIES: 16S rRNA (cytidine(1402)-2'-O)-methyltransferase [Sporomusa]OLS56651.1 ribosomal RNA small subunit methyltransferase I [Sporomusa sphaeroides DSM 2875]CVK18981.1 Ribosomal RNA small subunit methyltransferase I [Sporomusa sphaeroides DSM 2875]HML32645.1 16S rRNA (cytidine(1402)-2'-O)-methyltransferase [Sporomusa sphaeroides]
MNAVNQPGTLYLCPTPLGNLEDMSFRAVRVLKEAAAVAAEDTRHTIKLLNHFDIHVPLISYHEHNKAERGPEIVRRLLQGETIALVSDAGMPGISDPGVDLVRLAIEQNIPVVPLPGPNAALTALIASGLDTTLFTFVGFLPKTNKHRRELLAKLARHPYTLVFYESPHRLKATLEEIKSALGDRQAVAARELTKKFEEFVRGTLGSISLHFNEHQPRGEFTLIVAGISDDEVVAAEADSFAGLDVIQAVQMLIERGINKKDAIREVASQKGLPKRQVYQAVLDSDVL